MATTWQECPACGAVTRHDDGVCIRSPRHPRFDVRTPPALKGSTATVATQHRAVVITRDVSNETVNGVRREGRAYITGPHFGGVYSSTTDPAQASRFEQAEAERLIALGRWRSNGPRIEPEPEASDG